jgi:hypothetical protein
LSERNLKRWHPIQEKSKVKSDSISSGGIKSWNENDVTGERMEEYYEQIP